MNLFKTQTFRMHSGDTGRWKIECDALTDSDIDTLSFMISEKFDFSGVHGVPSGAVRLEKALEKYSDKRSYNFLIVDDVLTTGASMMEARNEYSHIMPASSIIGVVLFARILPPAWVYPVFQLWSK
jgi:hypoxanthine phosphoribosyltransferase